MGNCVVSMMDKKGQKNLVDEPFFKERLTYGDLNVKITEDQPDRSGIYRCSHITDEEHKSFCTDYYTQKNVLQELKEIAAANPKKNAIAYRNLNKVVKEKVKDEKTGKEKDWQFFEMSDIQYITFQQFWSNIEAIGKGMAELGIKPGQNVALYEETRWEWITTVMGLWSQNMTSATVYSNLGYDGLLYALKEAQCSAIVCNGSNVKKLLELMQNEASTIGEFTIIYLDSIPADVDAGAHRVISWVDVLKMGQNSQLPEPQITSDPDQQVLIMYTSGTVAEPKGVIHSIGALTQAKYFLSNRLRELLGKEEDERYISYLPSAHIFEFICELIFLTSDTLLCFGSPRTLTDVSCRPCGDITAYQPFFLIGVPRIFETIKKAIEAKLPAPGTLKRKVFDLAYERRRDALLQGKDTPYWNEKVFQLPRKMMGSRLKAFCSGGAPLADTTQEWIIVVLGVQIAQGYGLTETVCNAAVQRTGELKCVAGQLLRGVEMCLLDTDEYKHTDKPNPRGEMLLRGNCTFKGYYKQDDVTKAAMLPGGWFRTGDVAEVSEKDKQIYIIGRVKALAKNQLGEYIAMEQLECIYGQHPVSIPNGVCVLVHSQRTYIAAMMLTDEDKTMKWAKMNNIAGTWPSILDDAAFLEAMVKSLQEIALKANRKPFEFVKSVRVLKDEWTPENGIMTASMKLRRSQIDRQYATTIAELFAKEN